MSQKATITIPSEFESWGLPEQLRFLASRFVKSGGGECLLSATMREAADELQLNAALKAVSHLPEFRA